MNRAALFVSLLLLGCSPEKARETLAEEPIAAADTVLEEVADSVTDASLDGTATSTVPLDVRQQLPAELEVHLDRTHGLWQFPTLTPTDLQRIPEEEQGPYYVQADFNGDKKQDYAIQLMERDSAFVYAFVMRSEGDFQEFLLERDKLYDMDNQKRSIHYLRLAKKTDRYYDYATKQHFTIAQDGISVGAENYTATYVWEKGKFRKFETGD
ncbi:hypothetical protein [Rufibacter hautae]|uniref:Lipoprotein n=1 Tax=Rufibacter hautae TaxID=2595005 RepID=A0A5B6TEF8_9BACT|nr:hypothetical protein [Rufibacter hautae]KAA3437774.1 hypothetical protein FOA19_10790 [Rufibacter hautae]